MYVHFMTTMQRGGNMFLFQVAKRLNNTAVFLFHSRIKTLQLLYLLGLQKFYRFSYNITMKYLADEYGFYFICNTISIFNFK